MYVKDLSTGEQWNFSGNGKPTYVKALARYNSVLEQGHEVQSDKSLSELESGAS